MKKREYKVPLKTEAEFIIYIYKLYWEQGWYWIHDSRPGTQKTRESCPRGAHYRSSDQPSTCRGFWTCRGRHYSLKLRYACTPKKRPHYVHYLFVSRAWCFNDMRMCPRQPFNQGQGHFLWTHLSIYLFIYTYLQKLHPVMEGISLVGTLTLGSITYEKWTLMFIHYVQKWTLMFVART